MHKQNDRMRNDSNVPQGDVIALCCGWSEEGSGRWTPRYFRSMGLSAFTALNFNPTEIQNGIKDNDGQCESVLLRGGGNLTFLQRRMEDLFMSAEREVLQQGSLKAGQILITSLWNDLWKHHRKNFNASVDEVCSIFVSMTIKERVQKNIPGDIYIWNTKKCAFNCRCCNMSTTRPRLLVSFNSKFVDGSELLGDLSLTWHSSASCQQGQY